jgi:hypothetical protein
LYRHWDMKPRADGATAQECWYSGRSCFG